jgi:hypothetical protein
MKSLPPFSFCLSPFALRSRGQALLIAVLVLFAVATLGALLAAIVGAQLTQVARQSDVVALRNIAEAGLRLANEELTYSALGADWRPNSTPYLCGDGQVTVEVSYGPSPDRLQSRFLNILATAVFPDNPFLRHSITAYKPILLTDYVRFVTDRFEANQAASLGVSGLELGGAARPDYVSAIEGPIRSNTDLVWYGRSVLGLRTTFDSAASPGGVNWSDLGILRDDRVEVAGRLSQATYPGTDDALELLIDGTVDLGATNLFVPQTPTEQDAYSRGFARVTSDNQIIPNTTAILADLPELTTTAGERTSPALQVPRVRAPEIDAIHPDKETNRYWELTRDSGLWKQTSATEPYFNTGEFGWGWANYGGIYIDNGSYVDQDGNAYPGDIQYNHDLEKLRLNWTRSVGAHQTTGDRRPADTQKPPTGPSDWWDKTGRYYAPPGVEVILHGEDPCPYIEVIRHDVRGQTGSHSYWRDLDGTPIPSELEPARAPAPVVTWQYTPQPGGCAPPAASEPFGVYDGNRARFPFPPNGVIYAEGNIRASGIMPPVRDSAGHVGTAIGETTAQQLGYFGELGGQGRDRRFDLQIVSGGTIYIEGDLLSPSSAHLGGLLPKGSVDDHTYYSNDELYGSRLALLARDSVCVNTTALNPRPADMFKPKSVTVGTATSDRFYNDAQPTYPPSGQESYQVFEGDPLPEHNTNAYGAAWNKQPLATDPESINFIYTNPRFQVPDLASQLADVRLILGHSALYVKDAQPQPEGGFKGNPFDQDKGQPPADTTGPDQDQPFVTVDTSVNGTVWPWDHGVSPYKFMREDASPAPATANESTHWYVDVHPFDVELNNADLDNWLELLPDVNQARLLPLSGANALAGISDIIQFVLHVSPVRRYDESSGEYVGWLVPPRDLIYVLGPVAVAPPNRTGGNKVDPLPVEIDALIYAQNGSWFILPGRWFNDDADEYGKALAEYPGYHEPLNMKITVNGAISENMPADLGSVADWTSKWCGPAGQSEGFLTYVYDPLLRYPRFETRDRIGYLRFPNFPITSDLVIWGERVSGAAGS